MQGLIDVEKEVAKLMTKKGDLEKQMEKLREKMAKSDYKEKVPVKVQEQDAEKVRKRNRQCFLGCEDLNSWKIISAFSPQLRQSQTELEKVKEAMDNFRKMM